jgi:hypothetical protein
MSPRNIVCSSQRRHTAFADALSNRKECGPALGVCPSWSWQPCRLPWGDRLHHLLTCTGSRYAPLLGCRTLDNVMRASAVLSRVTYSAQPLWHLRTSWRMRPLPQRKSKLAPHHPNKPRDRSPDCELFPCVLSPESRPRRSMARLLVITRPSTAIGHRILCTPYSPGAFHVAINYYIRKTARQTS